MRFRTGFRAALIAAAALAGVTVTTAANADSGSISIHVIKGGWIIGAQGGSGVLNFHGRSYRRGIGGISWGLTFGGADARLSGRVSNIRSPSDVAGVYGAACAGAAIGAGAQVITLRNEKGAVLTLSGRQAGLMVNADLSGLTISVQ